MIYGVLGPSPTNWQPLVERAITSCDALLVAASASTSSPLEPLPLSTDKRVVTIRVQDPQGKPVPLAMLRGVVGSGEDLTRSGGDQETMEGNIRGGVVRVRIGDRRGRVHVFRAQTAKGVALPYCDETVHEIDTTARSMVIKLENDSPIKGRVLDASGKPKAGVRVGAFALDDGGIPPHERRQPPLIAKAISNRHGQFSIRGLPSAPHSLAAFDESRIELASRITHDPLDDEATLQLSDRESVSVTVQDQAGKPVREAIVLAAQRATDGSRILHNVATDRNGRALLPHMDPSQRCSLEVNLRLSECAAPAKGTHIRQWMPKSETITLDPGWSLRGKIRGLPDKRPPNVVIYMRFASGGSGRPAIGRYAVHRDGSFHATGLHKSDAKLSVEIGGQDVAVSRSGKTELPVKAGKRSVNIRIQQADVDRATCLYVLRLLEQTLTYYGMNQDGQLPNGLEDLLKASPRPGGRAYLESIPNDPWGLPYRYERKEDGRATVTSSGPNRKLGDEDDLTREARP